MALGTLEGKVAVVTGGSQGLGEAIARRFASSGAAGLVICGRDQQKGQRVADAIEALGCPTIFVTADLQKVADARKVIRAADEKFKRIDVLINAAGLTDRGTILDTTEERFDEIFAVNVRAPFFLIQEAVKIMRRERIHGSIVNIQSICAHGGQPYLSAYSSSKGALLTLTLNLANALLSHRIRVNGINVGWTLTPGEDRIQREHHGLPKDWYDQVIKTKPFGRLIMPDEIARACLYLASDESGLMTGANIDFDQIVYGPTDTPLSVEEQAA
ncbi:SDR family oxidoreductase [Mesorhizobium sp. WSM3876]|uniref:SDR family oxidoreductase n=1 Tax=Mesorhizobium sp. WSM3876 TaxID=422277 RepID=UPI000BAE7E2F|nr:SDR family oxidoreductase [Mesorhizobium sp. WSM3876]PBB84465.1 short-chain dehydrogenase [Mesorhizobium sp. WSM3876]